MKTAANICAFARNIDVVRRLSFAPSADVNTMNSRIYDYWVSQESASNTRRQETPVMKATARTKSYQKVLYDSMFTAYDVQKIDAATGAIDFVVYTNYSGSNGNRGNLDLNTDLMMRAIVKNFTSRTLTSKRRSFPAKGECNVDEWARGNAELSCPSHPGGFFINVSLVDFIASYFLIYILLLHFFVITSMIVYEKENRLRMIMKMMGLSDLTYWVVNYLFYLFQYLAMVLIMWAVGSQVCCSRGRSV